MTSKAISLAIGGFFLISTGAFAQTAGTPPASVAVAGPEGHMERPTAKAVAPTKSTEPAVILVKVRDPLTAKAEKPDKAVERGGGRG